MPITGYLEIPNIDGESTSTHHESEIDVHGMKWAVEQMTGSSAGRGRVKARADMSPLRVRKYYDAASPYLAQAVHQAKVFDEVVLSVRKDSGDAHLDYLIIKMERAVLTSYTVSSNDDEPNDQTLTETVDIEFEAINITYAQQNNATGATIEHEVELSG
ncbi:MAG: type VI secretion system tube protein Hcp [Pseudomonadota bacterium]